MGRVPSALGSDTEAPLQDFGKVMSARWGTAVRGLTRARPLPIARPAPGRYQALIIALLAVPIIIQVYLNAGIAYGLNRALGVPHNVACPSALIGASNFFELAVAAAIALFGFQSGAALATVVGVLVEVPVMLSVVRIVLRSRGWYEHARTV